MSLESIHSEKLSRCENCGKRSLSPVVITGRSFCSNLCYTEWLWKRERERTTGDLEGG